MYRAFILGLVLAALAGCTTIKRMTGQIDDTILPGERHEILPPDQQVAPDPNVIGNPPPPPGGAVVQGAPAPGMGQPASPPAATAGMCDPKVDYCASPGAQAATGKPAAPPPKKTHTRNKKVVRKKPAPPPVPPPPASGDPNAPSNPVAPPAPQPQGQ